MTWKQLFVDFINSLDNLSNSLQRNSASQDQLVLGLRLERSSLDRLASVLESGTGLPRAEAATSLLIQVWSGGQLVAEGNTVDFTLQDNQKSTLRLVGKSARGNPATFTGTPAWTLPDGTLFASATAADGLSVAVSAVGPLGSADFSVVIPAAADGSTPALSGAAKGTVVGGPAVAVDIMADAPVPQ